LRVAGRAGNAVIGEILMTFLLCFVVLECAGEIILSFLLPLCLLSLYALCSQSKVRAINNLPGNWHGGLLGTFCTDCRRWMFYQPYQINRPSNCCLNQVHCIHLPYLPITSLPSTIYPTFSTNPISTTHKLISCCSQLSLDYSHLNTRKVANALFSKPTSLDLTCLCSGMNPRTTTTLQPTTSAHTTSGRITGCSGLDHSQVQ